MPFTSKKLSIPGLQVIQPKIFPDDRGFFLEVFKSSDFRELGINEMPVQVNHSKSSRNVLRGLHYQLNPMAQAKLVRVLSGEILDVAVDIRKGSPTYSSWAGEVLSADNRTMLFLPQGFAHGFCVLSDTAEIEYYVFGGTYSPEHDRGILWNDPDIAIDWPVKEPVLSAKDTAQPHLKGADNNFVF